MANDKNDKEEKTKDEEKKAPPKDNIVVSKHSATIGGKKIRYTVTTGTMVLKEEAQQKKCEKEGESEG